MIPIEYPPKGKTGLIIIKQRPHAEALLKELNGPIQIYGNWNLNNIYFHRSRLLIEQLSNANNADIRVTMVENFLEDILNMR